MTGARTRRTWFAAAALTALAAIVRFATLGHQSYWLDEAYTVRALDGSARHMLAAVRHQESTPPLYYVLAWVWRRPFGLGPVGLRSLSAVAGTLTVPVVYAIGARVARPRAGVVAALIVVVAPLAVWFSQEARAYALGALLVALSLLCLVAAHDSGRRRWWAGWAVASMLALATHYYTASVIAPEVVWVLWQKRGREQIACVLGIVLTAAALAPLALAQRAEGHANYIASASLARRIVQVPKQLLVGYATPAQAVSTALAALLVGVAVAGLWLDPDRARRARGLLVLGLGAIAIAVPMVLAVAGLDYFDTRNLLPVLPILAVAVGCGLTAPAPVPALRLAAPALVVVLLAVTVLGATQARYQRDDWRGLARALGPASGPRAMVVTPSWGWIPLSVFNHGIRPMAATGLAVREVDLAATAGRGADGAGQRPPRPPATLRPPPGFAPAGQTTTDTYTIVRFRAPAPVVVTPASLAATHLGETASLALSSGSTSGRAGS